MSTSDPTDDRILSIDFSKHEIPICLYGTIFAAVHGCK